MAKKTRFAADGSGNENENILIMAEKDNSPRGRHQSSTSFFDEYLNICVTTVVRNSS